MSEIGERTALLPTRHFDTSGREVWPCRCGETHMGEYGFNDYMHHNCFHDAPLWDVPEDDGHFLCSSCGKSFFTSERWNAS